MYQQPHPLASTGTSLPKRTEGFCSNGKQAGKGELPLKPDSGLDFFNMPDVCKEMEMPFHCSKEKADNMSACLIETCQKYKIMGHWMHPIEKECSQRVQPFHESGSC